MNRRLRLARLSSRGIPGGARPVGADGRRVEAGLLKRHRKRCLAGAVLVAGALVAAGLLLDGSDASSSQLPIVNPAPLPAPVSAPIRIPARAVPLPDPDNLSRWLTVLRPTAARDAPSEQAQIVARLTARTPERTTNIVLAIGDRLDPAGRLWLKVRLPVLPNGTTGWIPRSALGGNNFVRTRLVVDSSRFTAILFSDGRPVFRARVGVGLRSSPTPKGTFYVRNKLTSYRSAFYGPLAFGTSARSATLTDWPAGGFIGIHGTNRPDLLPGRVSHGCIRMRNADIVRLAKLMPLGTPLTIT